MSKAKIVVVDDEKPLRDFVVRNLQARGFETLEASNGYQALAIHKSESPDLILIDLMMPGMDGLEAVRRLREKSNVPILVLTALGEEQDKVRALDAGADDCLLKPFGVEELMARVRAALRRSRWSANDAGEGPLRYRDLEMDPASRRVTLGGATVTLTRTEFRLLHALLRHRGKVVQHETLLKEAWGEDYGDETEYLRVYVGRLRSKLETDPQNPAYLFTEYGLGYRLGEDTAVGRL
ncbi:MAG: response regulator transcription factor [Acidimicrobiia bacterium]